MGEVYRALDLTLNQAVALKFISHAARTNEAALAWFRNEVRIARQVLHPNVCRVYDIGVIEGLLCLGRPLASGPGPSDQCYRPPCFLPRPGEVDCWRSPERQAQPWPTHS
jgi:serine/threonine protein kinase